MLVATAIGAWAQEIVSATTADEEGAEVRRLEVTLSGNWLDGENVVERTTMLIDEIMGYEDGAFNASKAFTEVTIKSKEGTTVTVNQRLMQQLLTGKVTEYQGQLTWHTSDNKITRLDLSDIAVAEYVGHEGSSVRNPNATLFPTSGVSPVVYFAMPSFEVRDGQTYTIPSYTTAGLEKMDELIIPANTKKISTAGFADGNFNKFKLNVGLEFIGNAAFYASSDRKGMGTLDIPSTVKYIGPEAFWFRSYTDIYFHSAQAPICPIGKGAISGDDRPMLYEDCYMGNNGFSDIREFAENQTSGPNKGKPGKANRENYFSNGGRWMVMIHFPSSAEMAAQGETLDIPSYKDATRVYNKVYGTIYYNDPTRSDYDAGKVELAIPGHEQEYIERGKIWGELGSFDYVGKETSDLSYKGLTCVKDVNSGFEDTYRSLNYIWPCQAQWVRAYTTVALGYNWDGVTKYRPTLTPEQIAYMIEDNLLVDKNQDGTGNWIAVGQDIVYDEAMANAYNATLPGAVKAGGVKETYDAGGAIAYNATLDGHVEAGQSAGNYTAEEAIEYNASLPTAIHEGEVKEKWESGDAIANNAALPGARVEGDNYYTEASAIAKNATLPGAVSTSDIMEPAVEHRDAVYYTHDELAWINEVSYDKTTVIYHPAQAATYYSDDEITKSPNNNNQWYKNEDVENLDGYYSTEYLTGKGIDSWKFIYGTDTKLEDGVTLYKFTGIVAKAGATALGYDGQKPFMKTPAVAEFYETTADSKQASTQTIKIPEVEGHDDIYYTEDQAAEYNAKLPGAVSTEDVEFVYSATEAAEYNATLPNAVKEGDTKSTYTADEALAYNSDSAKNPGAVSEGDSKGDYTDETAAAFNATLEGAVKAGDTKSTYTAEEANTNNAALPGARTSGYSSKSYDDPAIADLLSLVAFQSTRRCVFAANDGGGDDYDPKLPESQAWWTICLPFSLTKAQIDKYFGEGTHVCLFNKVDRKIKNLEEGQKPYVKFYFTDDQYPKAADENAVVLKAHVPYMIFPTLEETDAVKMANVRIPMDDYYKETGNPIPTIVNASDGQEYRFIGNYDTKLPVVQEDGSVKTIDVVVPQYSYIYAKKANATGKHPYQFWFTQNAGIKWGANKCVIQSTGADRGLSDNETFFKEVEKGNDSGVKQITVFAYDDEETASEETAIEEVIYVLGSGEDQQVIYSVNGMKLDAAPNKGVYIKNGKKYLAK